MAGVVTNKYRNTRIIPIALILVIAAVSIAALVSFARIMLSSNGQDAANKVNSGREALLNTTEGHSVNMTVRGPIVADENFRSYQIAISPSSREFTVFKSFSDNPISNDTLSNSPVAYEQFVYALDKANLAKGTELTGDKNDLRGICAKGYIYEFQILKSNKSVKSLWTSSCAGSRGSLNASATQLMNLFTSQIPNANNVIKGIWR